MFWSKIFLVKKKGNSKVEINLQIRRIGLELDYRIILDETFNTLHYFTLTLTTLLQTKSLDEN